MVPQQTALVGNMTSAVTMCGTVCILQVLRQLSGKETFLSAL